MMKKLSFRPRLASIAVAVCVLLGISIALLAFRPWVKSSSQSDYPTLHGPALAFMIDLTLEQVIPNCDLIVDATVQKVDPIQTTTYAPPAGSAEQKIQEKTGGTGLTLENLPVHLTVNEAIVGESDSSDITLIVKSLQLDSIPDFQPGDRMIFFLEKSKENYNLVAVREGIYYIAFDDKVYPTHLTEPLRRYSGQSLRSFKEEIRAIAQQEH